MEIVRQISDEIIIWNLFRNSYKAFKIKAKNEKSKNSIREEIEEKKKVGIFDKRLSLHQFSDAIVCKINFIESRKFFAHSFENQLLSRNKIQMTNQWILFDSKFRQKISFA